MKLKEFTKERTVYLSSLINADTTKQFKLDLNKIIQDDVKTVEENIKELSGLGMQYVQVYKENLKYPDIIIDITNPGGSVYHGMSIYDIIKSINDSYKYNIKAICSGYVASMAIPILLACDERNAYSNTRFMIHSVSSIAIGKVEEMNEDLEETKILNEIIKDIIINNTKLTKQQLKENDEKKKDWWISANEALNLNLITKII